jgi:hypothetical protein
VWPSCTRRFAGWEAGKGISGLWHARRACTQDQPALGEEATDLADQIHLAEALPPAANILARGHVPDDLHSEVLGSRLVEGAGP